MAGQTRLKHIVPAANMKRTTDDVHSDLTGKGYKYHPVKSEPGKYNVYTKPGARDLYVYHKAGKVKEITEAEFNLGNMLNDAFYTKLQQILGR